MNRLEILCNIHNVQGGTIFQYSRAYGVDFLSLSDYDFALWCLALIDGGVVLNIIGE
jgi:hypothetical protein